MEDPLKVSTLRTVRFYSLKIVLITDGKQNYLSVSVVAPVN